MERNYVIVTAKWRSYRDHRLCDVSSPYVFRHDCMHSSVSGWCRCSVRLSVAGGAARCVGDAQRAPRTRPVQCVRQRRAARTLAADLSRHTLARTRRQLHRTRRQPRRCRAGKSVAQTCYTPAILSRDSFESQV